MNTPEADLLRAAMDAQGITDPETRAGIAAISMGESHMKGFTETGYAHTSNARIRQVFGGRVEMLSDDQLDALKASDRSFFNWVYGPQFQAIHHLGNTGPDDGFNFRGRGFIQLTGRANYTRYSLMIGNEAAILANPDLANDPVQAALLSVAYIKDRYKGGGFQALMACVGNNTPDIAATKTSFFHQFMASGAFAGPGPAGLLSSSSGAPAAAAPNASVSATPPAAPPGGPDPVIPDAKALQQRLLTLGLYTGDVDGKWGPLSSGALANYYRAH